MKKKKKSWTARLNVMEIDRQTKKITMSIDPKMEIGMRKLNNKHKDRLEGFR
jgi:hypothetical protein